MNTQLQFLSDTFQFETDATVTGSGEDDDGPYVVTNRTVFYPGGGGQEPDKGMVVNESGDSIPILKADYGGEQLRLYLAEELSEEESIKIIVNRDYRLQNARLHTAGHLLGAVVSEKLGWPLQPVKGFHYQKGAYVEFEPVAEIKDIPEAELYQAIMEDITRCLPVTIETATADTLYDRVLFDEYSISEGGPLRIVTIGSYKPSPCRGTHLHHTGEIGNFSIKQIRHKKGRFRISYRAGME